MSDACPNFSFVVSQDLLCLICTLDQKWTLSDISDRPITKLKLKPPADRLTNCLSRSLRKVLYPIRVGAPLCISDNDYIKVNKNDKKIIQVLYVVLWNVNQIEM